MLENTLNATMVTLKTRTAAKLHSPNDCKSPESYSVDLQLQPPVASALQEKLLQKRHQTNHFIIWSAIDPCLVLLQREPAIGGPLYSHRFIAWKQGIYRELPMRIPILARDLAENY